ncbi:MAG: heavy metal translocating P-type ATPase [Leptospiraceae bacterium]|nr:MAG: heavy metal translocating P-type ATPase [Leptospiraceae bacterium]
MQHHNHHNSHIDHHKMHDHHHHKHHSHKENHDHHQHHDHNKMIQDFKIRFWISLILTIPIVILSPMIQNWFGYKIELNSSSFISFFLSSIVFFYGGFPFLTGLWKEIKNKNPGMMTLIGIAIIVAYFYSSAITFGLEGKSFYWELATLIDVMLLGHWIEMKSIAGASRALELLVQLLPKEAHKIENNSIIDVPLEKIQKNDILLIKPGEKIPADGIIIEGESYINESMLTGESKPVYKKINDKIIGGSLNGNGTIKIKVESTGEESYLKKVIKLVEDAQKTKSKTQLLANTAAKWLTFISVGIGFLTLSGWLIAGYPLDFALERMVTVMVISCPHALGLAVPLVVAISTAISAKNGLLIKNRSAFENARKITAIVFDKTGTLTYGKFGVSKINVYNKNYTENDILRLAASIEQNSEHPIAESIVEFAKNKNISLKKPSNVKAIPGKGITGKIDNQTIEIASPNYLKELNIKKPEENYYATVVYVLIDKQLIGSIVLEDQIRKESYEAIKVLKNHHIKVMMATGDNKLVAEKVAKELGLDQYFAEVLPHQKLEIVKELQSKNEFVAMTGDGVNDAPALAQADIGIAIGSGTDIAAETADIILVNSNPIDIVNLILFGKATYQKMIQNLFWATGYNIIAIPLATGIFYQFGIILQPAIGAIFMSLSTVIVAFNAQLLKDKIKK